MPKAGCGLDLLEWHQVERLVKETCAQPSFTITVYDENKTDQLQQQDEPPVHPALGKTQHQDEVLCNLIQWIQWGIVSAPQELQGLPRLAWQVNNQFKSLQFLSGISCQKFETRDIELVLQQTIPRSRTHQLSSACHSSSTAEHLGVFETSEKVKQRFHWPGLQEDTKLFTVCQLLSGMSEKLATTQEIPSFIGGMAS